MSTMKDICVAWTLKMAPDLSEDATQKLAELFFNLSPAGELDHVISAGYSLGMIEMPDRLQPGAPVSNH